MSEEQKCTCPLCGKKVETAKRIFYGTEQTLFICSCGMRYSVDLPLAEARARFMQRPESVDDLLLQEIFSLREQLKIAVAALKKECPDFDDIEFLHRLKAVDYEQLMEEIMEDEKQIEKELKT